MSIWFLLNFILVIWAVWNVASGFSANTPYLHILLGFTGFLLFIFNWTRNAVFSTIRNIGDRRKKIRLAQFSKRIRPYHRYVGTGALIIILLHGFLVIDLYTFDPSNMKILTGTIAAFNLLCLVLSGWYRLLVDPRLKIRKLHIGLGISMFVLVIIHFIY
ncbi:hypothetical protein GCM10022378_08880 [Salinicoccus jeotgali]|uniref:Ferric oxidoreductase domain-containing protein n=1 Tax=Salinicoccus jeotgali TaxID=381634 RepID=A0ABP7ELQ3_9STAP